MSFDVPAQLNNTERKIMKSQGRIRVVKRAGRERERKRDEKGAGAKVEPSKQTELNRARIVGEWINEFLQRQRAAEERALRELIGKAA